MIEKTTVSRQKLTEENNTIRIGSKHQGRHILIADIIYIEADENYTFLHLKNGERILSSKCLAHYDYHLKHHDFIRIHRSYLVHYRHIKEYEKRYRLLHLSDNKILSVSYRKKSSVAKIINKKESLRATQEVA